MIDRRIRELSDEPVVGDIPKIAGAYHSWRNNENYHDEVGFCKVATIEEIANYGYVLSPSRYVGVVEHDSDDEPFEETMTKLSREMFTLFENSHALEEQIIKNLASMGFEQ